LNGSVTCVGEPGLRVTVPCSTFPFTVPTIVPPPAQLPFTLSPLWLSAMSPQGTALSNFVVHVPYQVDTWHGARSGWPGR